MLLHRTEREKYYKHGEKAKRNPKKYLSITIDGMDQAKHNLPHFNIHTKVTKYFLPVELKIYIILIAILILKISNVANKALIEKIFPCNIAVEMWPSILKLDLSLLFADFVSHSVAGQNEKYLPARSIVALVLLIRLYQ